MMYALIEMGCTDDFRRKHLNISFTAMALAIAVKEVFAELFSKSDRIPLISGQNRAFIGGGDHFSVLFEVAFKILIDLGSDLSAAGRHLFLGNKEID
jgi:hypothetical protein